MLLFSLLFCFFQDRVAFPSDLKGDALVVQIEKQIKANGGTPLVIGTDFHFFYHAENGKEPRIEGDFNFWSRGQAQKGEPMTSIGQGWYHLGVPAHAEAVMEYLMIIGDKGVSDPLNAHSWPAWNGPVSVARMPDAPVADEVNLRTDVPKGKLTQFSFQSKHRRNERQVFVYTPASYQKNPRPLPVLYLGDGDLYANSGQVPQILDNLIADKVIEDVIAVFIEPVDRWLEYRMFTLYRMMFLDELIPHLQTKWQLDMDQAFLIGSSRGGMMVLDMAFNYPDRFKGVIAFAPAVGGTDFMNVLERYQPKTKTKFSILTGTYDFWTPDGVAIHKAMKEKGYHVDFRIVPIGHSYSAWRTYLDELLPPLLKD